MSENISVVGDSVSLPDFKVRTSGTAVSLKEFLILALFLAVFLYSVISFLKIWDSTYRDISQSHFYQDRTEDNHKEEQSLEAALPPGFYDTLLTRSW